MNKVLVFTYAEGWNDLSVLFMSKFDDKEWDDRYQTIENDLVYKCGVNDSNLAILQPVNNLSISDDGVYLVYDSIDDNTLQNLLNQCKNDNLYILIHSHGVNRSNISNLEIKCKVFEGAHVSTDYYYGVFKVLTDDKPYKTKRIIKLLLNDQISAFLHGCMTPHNTSGKFCTAYNILLEEPCLNKYIEEFMTLYNHSDSFNDYKTQLAALRDKIEEVL